MRGRAGTIVAARIAFAAALAASLAGSGLAQQPPADDVTTVSPITVTGAGSGVPIPTVGKGAPIYTPEELHQMGYEARSQRADFENAEDLPRGCIPQQFKDVYHQASIAATQLSDWSRLAEKATDAEDKLRIDAADGAATMDQVDAAELERQRDVIEVVKADQDFEEFKAEMVDIEELIDEDVDVALWYGILQMNAAERASRKYAAVPKEFEDLKLQNIRAVERHDDKGEPYLFVTGSILNTEKKKISVPPLKLTAVDQFGYPLLVQEGEAKGKIEPGKAQAFTYSLKPSPVNTVRVVVTFAGLKSPRPLVPPQCVKVKDSSGGDHFALPDAREFQNQR